MQQSSGHTLKAFDDDIERLRALISQMGGLAEHAIGEAMRCLVQRDNEGALRVVAQEIWRAAQPRLRSYELAGELDMAICVHLGNGSFTVHDFYTRDGATLDPLPSQKPPTRQSLRRRYGG